MIHDENDHMAQRPPKRFSRPNGEGDDDPFVFCDPAECNERLRNLEHYVSGVDGNNGLRGDMRNVKAEQNTLKDRLFAMELRIATYVGVGLAVVFFVDKIWK